LLKKNIKYKHNATQQKTVSVYNVGYYQYTVFDINVCLIVSTELSAGILKSL